MMILSHVASLIETNEQLLSGGRVIYLSEHPRNGTTKGISPFKFKENSISHSLPYISTMRRKRDARSSGT